MHLTRHTAQAQTLRLPPGASRTWRADTGTEFVVMDGRVRLVETCRAVADQVISRSLTLEPGSHHQVEDAGWITLSAPAGGELRVSVPASITLADAWHKLRRTVTRPRAAHGATRT